MAARWIEPARRSGPLKAYAREAETRTLDLLEQSLTGRLDWAPHDVIRGRLLAERPCPDSDLRRASGLRARRFFRCNDSVPRRV